nr:creatininase family protein [Oribacterium sp. P6A1]
MFVFVLASGAFLDPEVQATISPENHWDFHGGEMETSMIMAIHPETVKLELSETGLFMHK